MTDQLELEHATLEQRLAGRRKELEPLAARLAAIPSEMVDAPTEDDRLAGFAEYGQLEQERTLLLLEIRELEKRERAARVAILQEQERQAHEVLNAAHKVASKARHATEAALLAIRVAQNGTIPEGKDRVLFLGDLRAAVEKAKAQGTIAQRTEQQARSRWEHAKNALDRELAA